MFDTRTYKMKLFGELVLLPRSKVNLAVNFETAIDNSLSTQPGCFRAQLTSIFIAKSTPMSTE